MTSRDKGLQNWTGGSLNTIKLIEMNPRFAKICIKAQEQKCQIVQFLQTWSSFLSTLFCSKYLQSNFEVPGPLRSLSWGLSFTVIACEQLLFIIKNSTDYYAKDSSVILVQFLKTS